jgi:hypothetical protein
MLPEEEVLWSLTNTKGLTKKKIDLAFYITNRRILCGTQQLWLKDIAYANVVNITRTYEGGHSLHI